MGVVLIAVALAGCTGSRPGADMPRQYAAAPPAPTADVGQTDLGAVPTGDPALDALLTDIAGAFERHDWRALAYALDPDEYLEQFGLIRHHGPSDAAAVSQVLEETFNLGTVGNLIYPDGLRRAERPFAGLDRIRHVSIDSAVPDGDFIPVEGRVVLDDRTSRTLSFFVSQSDGVYRVVVPMG